jgi:hypothetical protein
MNQIVEKTMEKSSTTIADVFSILHLVEESLTSWKNNLVDASK